MGLKTLFASGGLNRLKTVTDFSELCPKKTEDDGTMSPVGITSSQATGVQQSAAGSAMEKKDAKGSKKGTPTPAKGDKKTPPAGT